MPLGNLEILTGEEVKKQLKPADLDQFVALWADETFKPVQTPLLETKEAVENALKERVLKQEKDKNEFKRYLKGHFEEVMDKGDMIIAKVNGRVVGMVRVMKFDNPRNTTLVDGEIFEIGKAMIIPEERGKGIYGKIREQALAHVRAKYGDMPILAGTKTEATKKLNRKAGWAEIGFAEYLRIHGAPEEHIESHKTEWEKEGWTAFLYIPSKKPV